MQVAHPAGAHGEVKLLSVITMENIADSVLAEGLATPDELRQVIAELYEFATCEGTVLSIPRVVETWGLV